MKLTYLTEDKIDQFIQAALAEDIGDGDHSSLSSIPETAVNEAELIIKGNGILAGLEMAKRIFHAVDPTLKVELLLKDGQQVSIGDRGLMVSGRAISILSAERLALNCLQRMSGIATYTRHLTNLIKHTKARLLDTRKTTPNFRLMEKWAVAIGGGINHRFGLYDMIMLKDNHIDFAGGIDKAITSTQKYLDQKGLDLKMEVETRNLEEIKQVLQHNNIHRIMLDNMSVEIMREAVALINGRCETEASGGITEETITEVAETGVDFISVGALTHSIKSMDISLKAKKK
ncbi:carboxylating nicotinate-nucleotide diphosphorylase [Fulvivirgaceae bacterium BMA10]|uniref:nicotinate-nucleotide diphosphorylase (carboxylating) n=1 Tax=Splendidivirga corallicola TaxID=3051826 RepID=A0ABT8KMS2_9BACT|nr:carboxylating nicotinate-nucleotide diphosphorylase [Fulvivirgaceae bacterium BMA10]